MYFFLQMFKSYFFFFFFSSRRRHTRWNCDWSSDVCSSDLGPGGALLHLDAAAAQEKAHPHYVESGFSRMGLLPQERPPYRGFDRPADRMQPRHQHEGVREPAAQALRRTMTWRERARRLRAAPLDSVLRLSG